MKQLLYLLLILLATSLVGCKKQPSDPITVNHSTDTVRNDTTIAQDSVPTPPKAADGLFDDFVYSFIKSKSFQLKRTVFPLPYEIDGRLTTISRTEWKHERLHSKEDLYFVILSGAKQIAVEKDTALKRVVIERINLDKERTKHFVFEKQNGEWRLIRLVEHGLSDDVNSDFLTFYKLFESSQSYQMQHIGATFMFKTYDSDNFQDIEGLLERSQWPDFRPDLPGGVITNINYGQNYADSNHRIVMICSPSGGMGCQLTFVKKGEEWMMTRLEN